jgi:REP element-mobilizing transposase RayT
MGSPIAYFLTWTCYGTWLHGDSRGSVDVLHNQPATPYLPADPAREGRELELLVRGPDVLTDPERALIEETIRRHVEIRRWTLHALNVRTNHVHAVVAAATTPETVMSQFKAWCTRRFREQGFRAPSEPIWTEHGSTRYLWTPEAVHRACDYVLNHQ